MTRRCSRLPRECAVAALAVAASLAAGCAGALDVEEVHGALVDHPFRAMDTAVFAGSHFLAFGEEGLCRRLRDGTSRRDSALVLVWLYDVDGASVTAASGRAGAYTVAREPTGLSRWAKVLAASLDGECRQRLPSDGQEGYFGTIELSDDIEDEAAGRFAFRVSRHLGLLNNGDYLAGTFSAEPCELTTAPPPVAGAGLCE